MCELVVQYVLNGAVPEVLEMEAFFQDVRSSKQGRWRQSFSSSWRALTSWLFGVRLTVCSYSYERPPLSFIRYIP